MNGRYHRKLGSNVKGYHEGQRVIAGAVPELHFLRLSRRLSVTRRLVSAGWGWQMLLPRLQSHGGLAFWQHHRRYSSRIYCSCGCADQPRPIPGRFDRRTDKCSCARTSLSTGFKGAENANVQIRRYCRFLPKDRLVCAPPQARAQGRQPSSSLWMAMISVWRFPKWGPAMHAQLPQC